MLQIHYGGKGKTIEGVIEWLENTEETKVNQRKLKDVNSNINKMINKTLSNGSAPYNRKYAYCIDPHSPTMANVNLKGGFQVKNVIRITGIKKDDVKVYSYSNSEVKTKTITNKNQKKVLNMLAYLAGESQSQWKKAPIFSGTTDIYKATLAYTVWAYKYTLKSAGISSTLFPKKSYDQLEDLGKGSPYRNALEKAEQSSKEVVESKTFEAVKTNPKCESKSYYYTQMNLNTKHNDVVTINYKVYGPYAINRKNIKIGNVSVYVGAKNRKISINPNENKSGSDIYVHTLDSKGNLNLPTGQVNNAQEGQNKLYDGGTQLNEIKSGQIFYLVVTSNIEPINSIEVQSENVDYYDSVMLLLAGANNNQNFAIYVSDEEKDQLITKLKVPTEDYGNLKIVKSQKDPITGNDMGKMGDIGFKIRFSDGKYVKEEDNIISYVDENEATEFFTDGNGEIYIEGLKIGNYTAIETVMPYDGFDTGGQYNFSITTGQTVELPIYNEQKYVSISGKVWEDGIGGKDTTVNNVLDQGDYILGSKTDPNDIWLDNVKVSLKQFETDSQGNRTGRVFKVKEDTTTWDGFYSFSGVEIKNLKDYFVEFEYNGLKYKCVQSGRGGLWKNTNSSKASESTESRENFDKKFSVIENGGAANKGVAKDITGNNTIGLDYNISNHVAKLNGIEYSYKEGWNTSANTFNAQLSLENYYRYLRGDNGYNTDDHPVTQISEITNVNLGLIKRDQPDLAVTKDIQNIQLGINGYEHVYNYDRKEIEQSNNGEDGFAVGVKFGNKYGNMSYTRPIYKSDYQYTNSSDPSKELKVYITYKIRLRNQATTIDSKVNSLVDYYDSKYVDKNIRLNTALNIGTDGRLQNTLQSNSSSYNDKYKKLTIDTSGITIGAGQTQNIYIQFELSREQIASIMESGSDSNKILDNVAEINSYSSYYKGTSNVYGGVDTDSAPGNATPENKNTYEDDTDSAPSLKLEQKDARQVSGKVFLDNSTSNELQTGKIRVGSGKYEDGEEGISNVLVALKSTTGGKTYYIGEGIEKPFNSGRTDENGDFTISGFIPDKYELVYYWGGETLKNGEVIIAEDYKGTVVDKNRYDNATQNSLWYQTDPNTRYSDAVDNYVYRTDIDERVGNKYEDKGLDDYKNYKRGNISNMESATPVINFRIENSSELEEYKTTSSGIEKQVYTISNIDFGITERARQESEIRKRVSKLKLTLANGQVISEANFTYDKNGKLKAEGETKHMTFMGTTDKNKKMEVGQNGFIKLELDNELIQGATLEATYEMEFYNKSELDYQTEQFYKYGIVDDESKVVKQTPSLVIDYLDDSWSFEESKNEGWKVITTEELKKFTNSVRLEIPEETLSIMAQGGGKALLDEELINKIENKTILVKASKDAIEPTATQPYQLKVSKVLTTTDDISLENDFGILVISKNGGRLIAKAPGKYVPGETLDDLSDKAEEIIVTPSTGKDLNFVVPITIGIIALITLGTGVILIKKKVIDNK